MSAKRLLGLSFGEWELRVINYGMPFVCLFMGFAAYRAFRDGDPGAGIACIGFTMMLFAAMVGPVCWGIVEEGDASLRKILSMVSLLGVLTMATGLLIQVFPG